MPSTKSKTNIVHLNGVKPAEQARSVELQYCFALAGRTMLEKTRLADIRIPELAQNAGSSIGGFYSRFENKEGLFEFMRNSMLEDHGKLIDEALNPDCLQEMTDTEVIENIVDLMIKNFSSPWRGVLRESYSRISEGRGFWAPMRFRAKQITDAVAVHFAERFKGRSDGPDEDSIRFAMQMLFSALNNDLMNPKLRFSIGDDEFRDHLTKCCADF